MMKKNKLAIVSEQLEIEVAFFDVDSMDIVWHGNYFKYFEIARCKLLTKIDYDYPQMKASGYAWPVVDIRAKYVRPASFQQQIIVTAAIIEYENRLKIEYLIEDKKTEQKLTTGYSVQVAVDMNSGEMCYLSPLILQERLEPYLGL